LLLLEIATLFTADVLSLIDTAPLDLFINNLIIPLSWGLFRAMHKQYQTVEAAPKLLIITLLITSLSVSLLIMNDNIAALPSQSELTDFPTIESQWIPYIVILVMIYNPPSYNLAAHKMSSLVFALPVRSSPGQTPLLCFRGYPKQYLMHAA
jgi:hypothetical protein